jgi:hypothetical protein
MTTTSCRPARSVIPGGPQPPRGDRARALERQVAFVVEAQLVQAVALDAVVDVRQGDPLVRSPVAAHGLRRLPRGASRNFTAFGSGASTVLWPSCVRVAFSGTGSPSASVNVTVTVRTCRR